MAKAKKGEKTYNMVISWSGDRSKKVAVAFRKWLPSVLQAAKPWMSETDIEKGSTWSGELGRQLDSCSVGVMFLTPENLGSEWLHFEAGALAKTVGKPTRVMTVRLGGLKTTNMTGPLGSFQRTNPTERDMKKLVLDLAVAIEAEIDKEDLAKAFDGMYPSFAEHMDIGALPNAPEDRSEKEMLGELLDLMRDLKRELSERRFNESLREAASSYLRSPSPDSIVIDGIEVYVDGQGKVQQRPRREK